VFIDHVQYPIGRTKFLGSFLPFGLKVQVVGVGVRMVDRIVNVTEKRAQFLDDLSARGIDKRLDRCVVKLPVMEKEQLSFPTRDIAIAIHVGVLIKYIFHVF
jgi:hypothetical protein